MRRTSFLRNKLRNNSGKNSSSPKVEPRSAFAVSKGGVSLWWGLGQSPSGDGGSAPAGQGQSPCRVWDSVPLGRQPNPALRKKSTEHKSSIDRPSIIEHQIRSAGKPILLHTQERGNAVTDFPYPGAQKPEIPSGEPQPRRTSGEQKPESKVQFCAGLYPRSV